ncbi:hypothetical protein C7401_115191 [Paraburkholderia unamae]|uniref:hypothetical protein n=1 Tax=Paraburkholderia unamae TaxID=219649 RepID=UPI000DC548E0|nr:hypothetical protein [Paraburkholderia unamae]RAR57633.1 hypothetical protein C7401_115191 [Paraburkholderia unamae]
MSDSKTYNGVTPEIFSCLKTKSKRDHGTIYDPAEGNTGTASTSGVGWAVKLQFNFNPEGGQLQYTVLEKSWIVPVGEIWSGISDTINSCR